MSIPPGYQVILALVAAFYLGSWLIKIADRVAIEGDNPLSDQSHSAFPTGKLLTWSYLPVAGLSWLGGGTITAVFYGQLFEELSPVAVLFVVTSALCILGIIRGLYELVFAIGIESKSPLQFHPVAFIYNRKGMRNRGLARLLVCGGAIFIMLVIALSLSHTGAPTSTPAG